MTIDHKTRITRDGTVFSVLGGNVDTTGAFPVRYERTGTCVGEVHRQGKRWTAHHLDGSVTVHALRRDAVDTLVAEEN